MDRLDREALRFSAPHQTTLESLLARAADNAADPIPESALERALANFVHDARSGRVAPEQMLVALKEIAMRAAPARPTHAMKERYEAVVRRAVDRCIDLYYRSD